MRKKQTTQRVRPPKRQIGGWVPTALYEQIAADAERQDRSIIGMVVWVLKQHYDASAGEGTSGHVA